MILLGRVALGITGIVFAGVGMLCSDGFVHVKVEEKQAQGHHIDVIAPAVFVPFEINLLRRLQRFTLVSLAPTVFKRGHLLWSSRPHCGWVRTFQERRGRSHKAQFRLPFPVCW
jgi:hypothetical protein